MGDGGKGQLAMQENEEDEIIRLLLGIMEGYTDTVIPPLSYFSPKFSGITNINEMGSSSSRKKQKKNKEEERQRRAEMREKYSVLQTMLPTLSNTVKAPKEKIIDNTVSFIKHLEQEEKELLESLKKIQREDEAKPVISRCITNPNSNVKFTASKGVTFLEIQLPFKRGSVVKIVEVLQKNGAEVLEARMNVNDDDDQRLLTFTATVMVASGGDKAIGMIREEILLNL
ncbi:hypothetical protein CASFOL_005278 [Castilleja foliolosa]|uniref:BHLH domain-containing protein n=1 Tax=Castilleja foliolosa TaxID=1961234 RepID=A0ABD3E2Z1_9LAMI